MISEVTANAKVTSGGMTSGVKSDELSGSGRTTEVNCTDIRRDN